MSGFHHTSINPHKHENGPSNTQGLFNIIIYIIRNYHSNATVTGGFDEKNGISSGLIIGNTFSRDTHP